MKKLILFLILSTIYFNSTAQQWEHVGSQGFSTSGPNYSGMAISSNGNIYTVANISNSSTEVWTFNNNANAWELVGQSNFSGGNWSRHQSICISDNDSLYVAMSQWAVGGKASVMKFDGSNWVYVGNQGVSTGNAELIDIATLNDSIYISFADFSVSKKLSVMKYNGTNWSYVGSPGITDTAVDIAGKLSLEIYNGNPCVAFTDNYAGGKISVMRFDGFGWVYVGAKGFSPGVAYESDLAIDNNGVPYVCFRDMSNGGKATVMKFDGTNWSYVGGAGITSTTVTRMKLDFDEYNRPHIAYVKSDGSNQIVVQAFDGASWSSIGGIAVPSGGSRVDFKVISFGKYYLSFLDYSVTGGAKLSVKTYDISSNIEELTNRNNFSIYPNPSNVIITIDNNGKAFNKVKILDLSGKVIQRHGFKNTLDVSTLPKGVYLIEIETNGVKSYSRFVKG